jgi:hypothetical protein
MDYTARVSEELDQQGLVIMEAADDLRKLDGRSKAIGT